MDRRSDEEVDYMRCSSRQPGGRGCLASREPNAFPSEDGPCAKGVVQGRTGRSALSGASRTSRRFAATRTAAGNRKVWGRKARSVIASRSRAAQMATSVWLTPAPRAPTIVEDS